MQIPGFHARATQPKFLKSGARNMLSKSFQAILIYTTV